MESLPTGISLVGALYEQKGPIKELLDKLSAQWRGKKSRLVVTGMAGVGKTTLVDCLSGRVFREDYRLPGRSTKVEQVTKTVLSDTLRDEPKKRLVYSVIPGQASLVRQTAREELFNGKTDITGVIHVVSGGLPTLRKQDNPLLDVHTLTDYRQYWMNKELADLDETCSYIERHLMLSRKFVWMLLTINKIDLFHQTLPQETAFYTSPDSPFVQRLTQLQNRIGNLFFQWEVHPVCSWLEDFEYREHGLSSTLKPVEFRAYLQEFLEILILNS
jgi:GTPase SAR1 family protein